MFVWLWWKLVFGFALTMFSVGSNFVYFWFVGCDVFVLVMLCGAVVF